MQFGYLAVAALVAALAVGNPATARMQSVAPTASESGETGRPLIDDGSAAGPKMPRISAPGCPAPQPPACAE